MIEAILRISNKDHDLLWKHLFSQDGEGAAFIYVKSNTHGDSMTLSPAGFEFIQSNDFVENNYLGLELRPETINKVIVSATKLKAKIVEVHSHPFSKKNTTFSDFDLRGFEEFVPHIWWRLNGGPYVALVYGHNDFDSLLWIKSPHDPQSLTHILLDEGEKVKPTGATLKMFNREGAVYENER